MRELDRQALRQLGVGKRCAECGYERQECICGPAPVRKVIRTKAEMVAAARAAFGRK